MMPFAAVKPIRGGRPLDGLFTRLLNDPAWMTQAKLDGQRAVWDGTLWSRKNLPISSPAVLRALDGVPVTLDGEYVSAKGERGVGVYWVYDLPNHPGTLDERWAALEALVVALGSDVVRLCPAGVTWPEVSDQGWEGLVFKRRASHYPTRGPETPNWVKYRAAWG